MRYFAEHNNILRIIDAIAAEHYRIDNTPEEPVICTRFGCGKHLTRTEQLYGNLCHEHSLQPSRDITKHLSL